MWDVATMSSIQRDTALVSHLPTHSLQASVEWVLNLSIFPGPVEVEVVLKSHPGVLEAVVVGTVDPTRGGTCVKAFVVLRDAHPIPTTTTHSRLTQELREHCLQRKAAHCCPQLFEFVSAESLPRTISGKVMRKRLRESGETSI